MCRVRELRRNAISLLQLRPGLSIPPSVHTGLEGSGKGVFFKVENDLSFGNESIVDMLEVMRAEWVALPNTWQWEGAQGDAGWRG